ncbi:hypothetical protein C8R45DRAFT_1019112 [Mycena sanguinolenta]|nr:hypothetical protein C8R45DRAFT_1019112 [Mycena sanguinolenta]
MPLPVPISWRPVALPASLSSLLPSSASSLQIPFAPLLGASTGATNHWTSDPWIQHKPAQNLLSTAIATAVARTEFDFGLRHRSLILDIVLFLISHFGSF